MALMIDALRLLRRRPHYRRLWASEAVSMMGDWFGLVAVSVVSYQAEGGGVLALAGALAAHLVPQAVAAPLGGWVADRFDRRQVLIAGSLIEGALTLGMVAAVMSGQIGVMQLLLAARSAASSAREPATGAALPSLVTKEELRDANALGALTWSVVFGLGMALGGLATAVSAPAALAVDALTFVVAASLLRKVPPLATELGARVQRASPLGEIAIGLRSALAPRLRRSVFAHAPVALAAGSGWMFLNLAGHAPTFGAGAATSIGLLHALRGVASGIGPVAIRRLRGASIDRAAHAAAVLVAAASVLLAAAGTFALSAVAVFAWGTGAGALWMILTTEIQENAPELVRGRCISLFGLGFTVMMSLGGWLVAALLTRGVAPPWVASGLAVASLAGWFALRRPVEPTVAPRPAT
jgi:MFS family permease